MRHSTHLHQPFTPSVPCLLCNFCPLQSGECISVFSYWLFWAWISLSFCCVKRLIFLNDAFELYSNRSFKSSVKPSRVTFLSVDNGVPDRQKQAIRYKFFVMNKSSLSHGKCSLSPLDISAEWEQLCTLTGRCCLAAAEETGRRSFSSKALFLYQNALSVGLWRRSFCSQTAVPSSSVKKITSFGIWATNREWGMWCLVCALESSTPSLILFN